MDYLINNIDLVWPRLVEHLYLSGVSLVLAALIALPLGLLLNRKPRLGTPVLTVLGIIYTIPSFAMFAFLVTVPFIGIGAPTAIVALTAYGLVVLARNTMVAFNSVDRAVKDAAVGMGMDSRQVLARIELPLALPVIVAGVRIAALSTIALATIAAWVGGLGLGQLLKDGINNDSKLYAGIICIAGIAILTDGLFRLLARTVRVP